MAITASGIGSNLDIDSIVTQLMDLEKRPLTALTKKEAAFQAKISALGTLKSALSTLQTTAAAMIPATGETALDKLTTFRSSVADTAIATATASSGAVPGTYSLEVTQLARQHRIATPTGASSPFDADNKLIGGGGTLTIALGTPGENTPVQSTTVSIADAATPEEIRDAINTANAGVSATVVNGSSGKQLVLVGNTAGSDRFIKLSGIAGLSYDGAGGDADEFSEVEAARGSAFKLNGILVTASTNTVTTAIDGLTINLLEESPADVATTLTVSRDNSGISTAINAFVKAYNDFNTNASSLGNYNATTQVAGTLNGDSTLRSAQQTLRQAINTIPAELTGSLRRLSDIGVTIQLNGSLAVDSAKLSAAITSDAAGVAGLASAYGEAFKTATNALIGTEGSIIRRTEGLYESIDGLSDQAEKLQLRLTLIEARYRKQFSALDTLMSQMLQTSNYLSQQLQNLPTLNSK